MKKGILVSVCYITALEQFIMLLYSLVLMVGSQCTMSLEEEMLFHLNADGYIECYEDLDCPSPVEVEEGHRVIQFSCSGKG